MVITDTFLNNASAEEAQGFMEQNVDNVLPLTKQDSFGKFII